MTCAGAGLRKKGKDGGNAAGHVAFEASQAVRAGVMHVSSLTSLSIWQRIVVAMLKVNGKLVPLRYWTHSMLHRHPISTSCNSF